MASESAAPEHFFAGSYRRQPAFLISSGGVSFKVFGSEP
jgi:hypothetical protein